MIMNFECITFMGSFSLKKITMIATLRICLSTVLRLLKGIPLYAILTVQNYFESIDEDDEYIDEATREILKVLYRYTPSKEHRPNPIVQMGLFMSGNGIPISTCINSGSMNQIILY